MDLGKMLSDWKGNLGTLWLWLGIVTLLLNIGVVGVESWTFAYGLLYSLGFLAVGLVLSKEEPGLLASTFAAIIGVLAVWVQLGLAGQAEASTIGTVSVLMFLVFLACEMVEVGGRAPYARYAVLAALLAWFLFPASYFYQRITLGMPLPAATILYHGGIMLLALLDFITFLGAVDFEQRENLRLLFAFLAIIGAFWLTAVLGWGLQLIR
ncbi:hypothetical protein DRO59_00320 [Candidatus Bathyarchaeota archaeon]|nr:MAG: hypothetical protein DRO59_00320 [Candidatus Bathyarchaeota archaeon]